MELMNQIAIVTGSTRGIGWTLLVQLSLFKKRIGTLDKQSKKDKESN
jgi:NAD(P)-dependent dehydrogenase (short-subunit alcohol dehydrogenase family)